MRKILLVFMCFMLITLCMVGCKKAVNNASAQETGVLAPTTSEDILAILKLTPGLSADTAYLIRAKSFGFGGSLSIAEFLNLIDLRFGYLKAEKDPANGASKDYYDLSLGMELKKAITKIAGTCKICDTLNPTLSVAGAVPTNMDFDKYDVALMMSVVNVKFANIPLIE